MQNGNNQFGRTIREARIRLGLSQARAAKASGMGETAFWNYERGNTLPVNIFRVRRLAQALELDASALWNMAKGLKESRENEAPDPSRMRALTGDAAHLERLRASGQPRGFGALESIQ